jgi:two-component system, response regulator
MVNQAIDILLIEDDPHDVELTMHAFQKLAMVARVHVIRNGAEALEFFHGTGSYANRDPEQGPKLILLDLKLPMVDGLYVMRQIRASRAHRTTPVVVLSSSSDEPDLIKSYQLGINSYIVKPVDFDAFIDTAHMIVQYWLSLNRAPAA